MKKLLQVLSLLIATMVLVGCSEASAPEEDNTVEMALVVGNLGDMSFADSANSGAERIEQDFPNVKVNVVEFYNDTANIEPTFLDLSDQGYDVIAMPSQFVDATSNYAPDYPETDYWLYGTDFNFEEGSYDNVYAMLYRSNEAAYVAGFLEAERSNRDLGIIGGMDNNVINDFVYGYIQGAQHANPDVRVLTSYIGSFEDTAKAKELTLAQYNQDVSSVFNISGPAGIGIAEASVESDGEAIGVDADQSLVFREAGREDLAEVVPTSVLTNVGESLHYAMTLYREGELPMGEYESLGLAEGAVGIAKNEVFRKTYSPEMIEKAEELEEQIKNGEVEVESVYDMTVSEFAEIRTEVAE